MKLMCTVASAREFWGAFDVAPKPSCMGPGNFYFFKQHIKPRWEDPANKAGGKWSLVINTSGASGTSGTGTGGDSSQTPSPPLPLVQATTIDEVWLNTLLACVGEQLGEDVCGCVVNVRAAYTRISVWIGRSDREAALTLGARWKAQCMSKFQNIAFQKHGEQGYPTTEQTSAAASASPRLRL
jgi:translation initiation factor 4E